MLRNLFYGLIPILLLDLISIPFHDHVLTHQILMQFQIVLYLLHLLLFLLLHKTFFSTYDFQYLLILFLYLTKLLHCFLQFSIEYFNGDFLKNLLVYKQYFIFSYRLINFFCFLHLFWKLIILAFSHDFAQ